MILRKLETGSGIHRAVCNAGNWLRYNRDLTSSNTLNTDFENYFNCKLFTTQDDIYNAYIVFENDTDCTDFLLRWS